MTDIAANLSSVHERIAEAALRSGRDPDAVCLVAVTKTFPVTAIMDAWAAGQRHFGENRAEEGAEKIPYMMRQVGGPIPSGPRQTVRADAGAALPVWHMIGHIQSRKAELVATYFDVIHSVDRLKIARRLSALAIEAGCDMSVLLECNVSGEENKYGFAAQGWDTDPDLRAALYAALEPVFALPGLRFEGLMTVAPIARDPEAVRPVFASLRGLREALCARFQKMRGHHLSMGMTDDFEVAVEEGSTMVRIGRAIFGSRAV